MQSMTTKAAAIGITKPLVDAGLIISTRAYSAMNRERPDERSTDSKKNPMSFDGKRMIFGSITRIGLLDQACAYKIAKAPRLGWVDDPTFRSVYLQRVRAPESG